MAQGSRPDRVGEEIRQELATLLSREVHDPGIGFVTLTRVKVSPDLQLARVFYTLLGDDEARKDTERGARRARRRSCAGRSAPAIRLRRVPEIRFEFDQSVENQDRIERILLDLQAERDARGTARRRAREPQDPAKRRIDDLTDRGTRDPQKDPD